MWRTNGGGPWKRRRPDHPAADFLFPQQVDGKGWEPQFLDYLFVAFTRATALSPADTYPLTRTAKALMMSEAVLSLAVVGILSPARSIFSAGEAALNRLHRLVRPDQRFWPFEFY